MSDLILVLLGSAGACLAIMLFERWWKRIAFSLAWCLVFAAVLTQTGWLA